VICRLLEKFWGTTVGLAGSTLLFALAHLPNEHFSMLGAVMTSVSSLVQSLTQTAEA